jgi:hypothetical protein
LPWKEAAGLASFLLPAPLLSHQACFPSWAASAHAIATEHIVKFGKSWESSFQVHTPGKAGFRRFPGTFHNCVAHLDLPAWLLPSHNILPSAFPGFADFANARGSCMGEGMQLGSRDGDGGGAARASSLGFSGTIRAGSMTQSLLCPAKTPALRASASIVEAAAAAQTALCWRAGCFCKLCASLTRAGAVSGSVDSLDSGTAEMGFVFGANLKNAPLMDDVSVCSKELLLFALDLAQSQNSPIFCPGTFHLYLTELLS